MHSLLVAAVVAVRAAAAGALLVEQLLVYLDAHGKRKSSGNSIQEIALSPLPYL